MAISLTSYLSAAAFTSDGYFSFLLSRPPQDVWYLFLIGLARIVPMIALTPFLGGKILADPMKLGLAVALVPLFLPYIVVNATTPLALDVVFIFLMLKEILIGSLLGFLISIPFYAAQGAGTLIDHQSGGQSLQVTDPSSQVQATPTGLLYNNMTLVMFFLIGGPFLFFDAVFTAYKVLPADQFIPATFFAQTNPLFFTTIKLLHQMFVIMIQLSAPSLIALLMSDLFLGIANRMAPQVQISFLMWSMKSYVGIAMLWAGWWFILKQIDIQSINWVKMLQHLMETIIPHTASA